MFARKHAIRRSSGIKDSNHLLSEAFRGVCGTLHGALSEAQVEILSDNPLLSALSGAQGRRNCLSGVLVPTILGGRGRCSHRDGGGVEIAVVREHQHLVYGRYRKLLEEGRWQQVLEALRADDASTVGAEVTL